MTAGPGLHRKGWFQLLGTGGVLLAWNGYCPAPVGGTALILGIFGLVRCVFSRDRRRRLLWLNLGLALVILAAFEGGLGLLAARDAPAGPLVEASGLYEFTGNQWLGYQPRPSSRIPAYKKVDDRTVFEVTYGIDSLGQRRPPPYREEARQALLFFGCSFTFGEGVEDHETLPFRVGVETGGGYRVYNFGVYGYGTHQMLAAWERGVVDGVVSEEIRAVVYQVLFPEHAYRAAGLRSWGRFGPRYILRDGAACWTGPFNANEWIVDRPGEKWLYLVRNWLLRSEIVRRWREYVRPIRRSDVDLFLTMIRQSKTELRQRSPGAEFHLLLWPDPAVERFDLVPDLEAIGDRLHRVEDILPEFSRDQDRWLIPGDSHPSAEAHERIAAHLAARLQPAPPGDAP